MKVSYKISLVAITVMSLALVMFLGAGMGSAAAPDPQLTNDLVFVGNGAGGVDPIKIVDVDAQAMVNAMGTGSSVNSNHGIQMSADGKYIYTANAALAGGRMRAVKFDIATKSDAAVYTDAAARQYTAATGLCGIEFNLNDPSGNLWVTQMSGTAGNGGGGLYEIDPATGFTGAYVDSGAGTDNRATCGIGWNASGSLAYTSLMNAKKTNELSWPGATLTGGSVTHSPTLHILDTNKDLGLVYVSGGNGSGVGSTIEVIDMATNTLVGAGAAQYMNPHSATLAHGNGFLYSHSRPTALNGSLGHLLVYDVGGGTAGGTPTNPVLIAAIPDGANGGGSCGNDVVAKSDYCSEPALSLSKTSTYWGSYADYTARQLSVDYSIGNGAGLTNAYNVAIVAASNSNGVTMASATAGGNIPAGSSAAVTIKYNIPVGVGQFTSTVYATANDLCNNTWEYPGPAPLA